MFTLKIGAVLVALMSSLWLGGFILDRAWPEPPAPASYYPSVGETIHSRAEGFTSRIIKADSRYIWLELTLAPHAPGPPSHVHTTFAEHFYVVKGNLSLRLGNEVKVLHPGEEFKVLPGVVHQPFNPTDEEVVVRGPLTEEDAIPRDFVLFLSQIYGYIDESPSHTRPPAVLLQMSIFAPRYDSWLASQPIAVQRVQFAIFHPIARLLGYRSYYERFAPSAAGRPS